MKTVLFVPGFLENLKTRDYSSTISAIKENGYEVKFVPIEWKRTTINNWVEELNSVYRKYDANDVILAGFSFGAMIAFVAATEKNPAELWLFSLSSYFAEDIVSKRQKRSWLNNLGHRRVTAFKTLEFKELSKKISCKTILFYGQDELDKWPIMNERAAAARKLIKGSSYISVMGVGHDVADKRYISEIEKII